MLNNTVTSISKNKSMVDTLGGGGEGASLPTLFKNSGPFRVCR